MEHMTQQSLAFDRKVQIENSEDYKTLEAEEAKLLQEVETFKEALASAQSDLVELRKKLRPLRKAAGTHKAISHIIYEYVRDNPDKRFTDIVRYLETTGHYNRGGSEVTFARQKGIILELENGTYVPGTLASRNPYGARISTVMEYARKTEWFEVRECYDYVKTQMDRISKNSVYGIFIHSLYKDKFEVDTSGKYNKFRLKDEYRRP